ncbi:MAG: diguanylate cyclase domain-containing protein [Magnetospiraceae bacterium]
MTSVLIVDDDDVDREMAVRALRRCAEGENMIIDAAKDAKSALDILKSKTYDCLVLDYRLPDFDGLLFLDLLTEGSEDLPVSVVMMTGEGSESVAVKAMKRGIYEYVPKRDYTPEGLYNAVKNAIVKHAQNEQREQERAEIQRNQLVDSLTGLGNGKFFQMQLDHLVANAERRGERFFVLVGTLNQFDDVVKTLGKTAGDRVMREISERLKKTARTADFVFCLAQDQFAVLGEAAPELDGLRGLCDRIVSLADTPVNFGSFSRQMGLSLGVAIYPQDGTEGEKLFKLARAAMNATTRRGGGVSFVSTH